MPLVFTEPQIRRYLAEYGYADIPDDDFEVFVKDLRKLIKYEDKVRKEKKEHIEHEKASEDIPEPRIQKQSTKEKSQSGLDSRASSLKSLHQNLQKSSMDVEVEKESQKLEHDLDKLARGETKSMIADKSGIPLKSSNGHKKPKQSPGNSSTASSSLESLHLPSGSSRRSSTSSVSSYPGQKYKDDVPESIKRDPVALYHYYKNYWNKRKPPGSDRHMNLRWSVRAGTMGKVPCTSCGERVNYLTRY